MFHTFGCKQTVSNMLTIFSVFARPGCATHQAGREQLWCHHWLKAWECVDFMGLTNYEITINGPWHQTHTVLTQYANCCQSLETTTRSPTSMRTSRETLSTKHIFCGSVWREPFIATRPSSVDWKHATCSDSCRREDLPKSCVIYSVNDCFMIRFGFRFSSAPRFFTSVLLARVSCHSQNSKPFWEEVMIDGCHHFWMGPGIVMFTYLITKLSICSTNNKRWNQFLQLLYLWRFRLGSFAPTTRIIRQKLA